MIRYIFSKHVFHLVKTIQIDRNAGFRRTLVLKEPLKGRFRSTRGTMWSSNRFEPISSLEARDLRQLGAYLLRLSFIIAGLGLLLILTLYKVA